MILGHRQLDGQRCRRSCQYGLHARTHWQQKGGQQPMGKPGTPALQGPCAPRSYNSAVDSSSRCLYSDTHHKPEHVLAHHVSLMLHMQQHVDNIEIG